MNPFRIAVVQYNQDPYDSKKNTKEGLALVRKAKVDGADLVLFPECWITGYEFPDLDASLPTEELEKQLSFVKWLGQALTKDCPEVNTFRALAKELEIGIVITGYTTRLCKQMP